MIFGDDKSDNDDNDDDKDVGKRGQTVLVCNNTWGGYCGGHGRTVNQITHSRQNGDI